MKTFFMAFSSIMIAGTSLADQCQVLDQSQAVSFAKTVKVGDYVGFLCEPCGEQPSEAGGPLFEEVKSVGVAPWMTHDGTLGGYEVTINGEARDLAYTFVSTGATDNTNVVVNAAYLVGCPASDVTTRFEID